MDFPLQANRLFALPPIKLCCPAEECLSWLEMLFSTATEIVSSEQLEFDISIMVHGAAARIKNAWDWHDPTCCCSYLGTIVGRIFEAQHGGPPPLKVVYNNGGGLRSCHHGAKACPDPHETRLNESDMTNLQKQASNNLKRWPKARAEDVDSTLNALLRRLRKAAKREALHNPVNALLFPFGQASDNGNVGNYGSQSINQAQKRNTSDMLDSNPQPADMSRAVKKARNDATSERSSTPISSSGLTWEDDMNRLLAGGESLMQQGEAMVGRIQTMKARIRVDNAANADNAVTLGQANAEINQLKVEPSAALKKIREKDSEIRFRHERSRRELGEANAKNKALMDEAKRFEKVKRILNEDD